MSTSLDTPRKLAVAFAVTRVVFAAALAAAPVRTTRPWLGNAAERPGGRVAVRGLAVRDGVVSAGVATAAITGSPVRPWLAACVAGDAADIAATLTESGLPERSHLGTVALAGVAAVSGFALGVAVER